MSRRLLSFWPQLIAACCFVYVIAGNVATLPATHLEIPRPLLSVGKALGLHQSWNVFGPSVPTDDGWFVVRGVRQDGVELDLLNGGSVRREKPVNVAATFPSYRWLAYLRRMWWLRHTEYPRKVTDYFCRAANAQQATGGRVSTAQLLYMLETTPPHNGPPRVKPVVVAESTCSSVASVP